MILLGGAKTLEGEGGRADSEEKPQALVVLP